MAVIALGVLPAGASAQTDTTAVTIPGNPLSVYVGPRGECQSSYLVNGVIAGNYFYGFGTVGDCGFFLAFPKASGQPEELEGQDLRVQRRRRPRSARWKRHQRNLQQVSQSPVTGRHRIESLHGDDGLRRSKTRKAQRRADHRDDDLRERRAAVHLDLHVKNTSGLDDLLPRDLCRRPVRQRQRPRNGRVPGGASPLHRRPEHRLRRDRRLPGGDPRRPAAVDLASRRPTGRRPRSASKAIASGDNGIWHDVETPTKTRSVQQNDRADRTRQRRRRRVGPAARKRHRADQRDRTGVHDHQPHPNSSGLQISPAKPDADPGQNETSA